MLRAALTWQAADVPCCALALGHRVPVRTPPAESTMSRVNDSPWRARRARTYAESREAGTGVTLVRSGPATSPVQAAVPEARMNIRGNDDEYDMGGSAGEKSKGYPASVVNPSRFCHGTVIPPSPVLVSAGSLGAVTYSARRRTCDNA